MPGSARPDGKLVWISNKHRDAAARECTSTSYGLNTLMHLFEAAPADPLAAIIEARRTVYPDGISEIKGDLRALGVPNANQERCVVCGSTDRPCQCGHTESGLNV